MMNQEYRFSMTGASLMITEFVELATLFKNANFEISNFSHIKVNKDRAATRKREFSELKLRLTYLTRAEIVFLTETRKENQKLIAFLSVIRTYKVLREFVEQVVSDKLIVFNYQLSSGDMSNFIYNKKIDHTEFDELSDSTLKKVQQVMFKMLEQAGLIDSVKSKKIQVPFLDFNIQSLLSPIDKKYLLNQ